MIRFKVSGKRCITEEIYFRNNIFLILSWSSSNNHFQYFYDRMTEGNRGKRLRPRKTLRQGKPSIQLYGHFPRVVTHYVPRFIWFYSYPRKAAATVELTTMFPSLFSAFSQIFWSLLRWNILRPSTYLLWHPIKVQLSGKSPRQFHYSTG